MTDGDIQEYSLNTKARTCKIKSNQKQNNIFRKKLFLVLLLPKMYGAPQREGLVKQ